MLPAAKRIFSSSQRSLHGVAHAIETVFYEGLFRVAVFLFPLKSLSRSNFGSTISRSAFEIRCSSALCLVLAVSRPGRNVFVSPFQNDIGDLDVVCTEHHHMGSSVEDRITQLVKLDIVRLRDSVARSTPGIDRINGGLALFAYSRVIAFKGHVGDVVEVLRLEPAIRE